MLKVRLDTKGSFAIGAYKVVWVPLLATGVNAVRLKGFALVWYTEAPIGYKAARTFDGLITTSAAVGKDAIKATLTEGVSFLFVEGIRAKGPQALRADEAVDVPFLPNRSNAAALNCL